MSAEVIGLMKADQFNLVKWTSNSQGVLESDPLSHRLSAVKEFDGNGTHRVLGLCRLLDSEMFRIKICLNHLVPNAPYCRVFHDYGILWNLTHLWFYIQSFL